LPNLAHEGSTPQKRAANNKMNRFKKFPFKMKTPGGLPGGRPA
jgi:hypothetical protein